MQNKREPLFLRPKNLDVKTNGSDHAIHVTRMIWGGGGDFNELIQYSQQGLEPMTE
jgi:hypothetical protein